MPIRKPKRETTIVGQVAYLPLSNGGRVKVDIADLPIVARFRWRWASPHKSRIRYAVTSLPRVNGRHPTVLMHRMIVGARRGEIVDHANRDGLDNTRVNLRVCPQGHNLANSLVKRANNSSGFKGVSLTKEKTKWRARITFNGREHALGQFDSKEEAARAYNAAARRFYGEFARLNEVSDAD